jgi:hypothetical protein
MEAQKAHQHFCSRDALAEAASRFCNAFSAKEPPSSILEHFSSTHVDDIIAYEHGLPQLAPFLGRRFSGFDGVQSYFDLIGECLTYSNMRFSNFVVDPSTSQVSVRGEARFKWKSTGQSWDEVFTYVFAFDEHLKVLKYEIWADSGAAYLASKGLLM